jgi:hypothetical protein
MMFVHAALGAGCTGFISSRPAEKVRDEVSIIFGYEFKANTDASIEISGAARKGAELTVKSTSAKGTASVDVYSLRGLPEALNRVGQECK